MIATVAMALLLAGCAGGESGGPVGETGEPTMTSSAGPTGSLPDDPVLPSPTGRPGTPTGGPGRPAPTGAPTGGPGKSIGSPAGRVQTLSGTVTAGVEPRCYLLNGYLLIGGPADVVQPGARITVTGRAEPDMVTTCQQGIPFVVATAERA